MVGGEEGHLQPVSHLFTWCPPETPIILVHLPLQVSLLFLSLPLLVLLYFPLSLCGFLAEIDILWLPHPWMKTLSSGWWWCVCRGVHIGPSLHESPVLSEFNFENKISTHCLVLTILRQWWCTYYQVNMKKVLNEENKMKKEKMQRSILKHAISEYCSRISLNRSMLSKWLLWLLLPAVTVTGNRYKTWGKKKAEPLDQKT